MDSDDDNDFPKQGGEALDLEGDLASEGEYDEEDDDQQPPQLETCTGTTRWNFRGRGCRAKGRKLTV